MSDGKMRLGLSMRGPGYHPAAWRHPDVPADGASRLDHYRRVIEAGERGKIDMVFFAEAGMHRLKHRGECFGVLGSLNVAPGPQAAPSSCRQGIPPPMWPI